MDALVAGSGPAAGLEALLVCRAKASRNRPRTPEWEGGQEAELVDTMAVGLRSGALVAGELGAAAAGEA